MNPTAPSTTKPAISTNCIARLAQIAQGRPCTPASSTSTTANPMR